MKYLTLILLFVCCASYAQTDTVPGSMQIDSLQQAFTKESDSLRKSYVQQKEKLGALKLHCLNRIDSLKRRPTQFPENPLDSLKPNADLSRYKKKIDSLDQQAASLEKQTTARLDSLGSVTESMMEL